MATCGTLPNTVPDGPTGTIVLKKIADDTYEQYGSILAGNATTSGPQPQVIIATSSTTIINDGDVFENFASDIVNNMVYLEDFVSHIAISTSGSNARGFGSGTYVVGTNTKLSHTSNFRGTLQVMSNGLGASFMVLAASPSTGVVKPNSNVAENPTYFMRWAQVGTLGGERMIGWSNGSFASTTPSQGVWFSATPSGPIRGVSTNTFGQYSVVQATVSAADGVFHAGKIIASTSSVQFFLDGVSIGTVTTNIPTADIGPGMGTTFINDDNGVEVDYLAMNQSRF